MKLKETIIGLLVILGGGFGNFQNIRTHKATAAADEEAAAPTVVRVQVAGLTRMTLRHYVACYGVVAPMPATATEPAADAPLAAPVAGVVARVNAVEGQQVEKGEVLVELNSGAATLDYSEQEVARQKKLFAEQNTSLRNLQNAEAQLALLRVTSPLSGTVARISAKPGTAVDSTTVLVEVMDFNRLALRVEVPAAEAGDLKTGEEVQVLTDPPVAASLSFVSPMVDTNNATILARAPLPAGSGLRPGAFVGLRIVTGVHSNCLAAPAESVVTDIDGHSVVALVNGDLAEQIPVQTGFRENGWVEINGQGLGETNAVVTVGAYGLPDKTKILVVKSTEEETSSTNSAPAP